MAMYQSMKIANDFEIYKMDSDKRFDELKKDFRAEYLLLKTKSETDLESMKNNVQSDKDNLIKVIESRNEKIFELSGWFKASNNLFYKGFSEKVEYQTARNRCQQLGARLISTGFRDPAVRSEIIPKICIRNIRIWIGLNDIEREGVWVWSDGNILTDIRSIPWRNGEPNNDGNEDCGEYLWRTTDDGVNDTECYSHCAYACEKAFS
uniref:CD209 antigen-like protein E n=1 Tax=Styela clava TaxID=7725 RepID=UPI00193A829D|nr:CD209 antigen-like protein E [Styela clava]